ncbi:hypothetical protein BDV93DRAFT_523977 [Ceratobasidium sp. AG-I]|nr:hypothetical protein BDV93DRAFT_523977 [Ceratobasidium sp. AG-I]
MPSPVLIIGGVVIAVGAGFAFKQFVYDPYLSEKVHLWVEDFAEQRRMRGRQLVDPHEASPSPRGNPPRRSSFDEKRGFSGGSVANAGISTGTEMRQVPFVSTSLRHRGAPFQHQHSNSEHEMATMGMGELSPLDSLDTPIAAWHSEAARPQIPFSAPVANPGIPTPPPTHTSPITSPRSPFSDLRALSEVSFGAPSSSDPFEEYQNFSPPPAAALSPPMSTGPAPFSPFVVPHAPPTPDPFVDVPAPSDARSPPPGVRSPFVDVPSTISERPTSPWSELSAASGATAGQGQLHLRLSRTDTDSEKEGSEAGSDGSWEHT